MVIGAMSGPIVFGMSACRHVGMSACGRACAPFGMLSAQNVTSKTLPVAVARAAASDGAGAAAVLAAPPGGVAFLPPALVAWVTLAQASVSGGYLTAAPWPVHALVRPPQRVRTVGTARAADPVQAWSMTDLTPDSLAQWAQQ
jgi:hypothetical protein